MLLKKFADYIVSTYVDEDSLFPPDIWAENSSSHQRTINACESFHSKLNESFYSPYPNIFTFIDVLLNFQIDRRYIRQRSCSMEKWIYIRKILQIKQFLENQIKKLQAKELTTFDFVKNVSHRFRVNKN